MAEIAPVWFTVPPKGYGGIELVVGLLADGLADRGHDVTLFASGGSQTRARLAAPLPEPPDPALLGNVWFDAFHALSAYLRAGDFDLVHDHSGIVGPALGAMLEGSPPVVHTLHGPWTQPAASYYSLLHRRVRLVAISEAQRDGHPDIEYAGTVYNGIDVDAYRLEEDKDDYLVYLGRSSPDKGPALAVEVARRAGLPMTMMVKKSEPFERDYWDNVVAPYLTDDITVIENALMETKVEVLAKARAMVFPIRWSEPFGLVMVEAMACGTPVITSPLGAAPELVIDGETGFLRHSVEDMVEALDHVGDISPATCRKRVEEYFSADAMVDGYLDVFDRVLG